MRPGQVWEELSGLSARLGMEDYFSSRGGADAEPADKRRLVILAALLGFGILAGIFYFFHAMLAFTAAISANTTAVYGPYPNTAVSYAVLPACAGLFCVLLDYFKSATGLNRLASPPGLAVGLALAALLFMLGSLPGHAIKHKINAFAAAHGYVKCANPFDPAHQRVYALQSYVAAYGCPAGPNLEQ